MRHTIFAVALVIVLAALAGGGVAAAKGGPGHGKGKGKKPGTPGVTIFASGFNNPRGLTFGPGGKLYVAEGGLGGTHSSASDPCPQAHGAAAPYFGSTNDPVLVSERSPAAITPWTQALGAGSRNAEPIAARLAANAAA